MNKKKLVIKLKSKDLKKETVDKLREAAKTDSRIKFEKK